MGASICWAAAEADTQFANFDLSALEKQLLIFYLLIFLSFELWHRAVDDPELRALVL